MSEQRPTERAPGGERLVDSPWFWVCLFASAAVAALLAIGPKYRQREARLESTFRMREHLARSPAQRTTQGDETVVAASEDGDGNDGGSDGGGDGRLIKSTGPLIWILAAVVTGGWAALFWSRRRIEVNPP